MTVQQRLGGTFNLGGGDAHAIAFLEDLVRGDGLPIDADEVIGGPPVRNALGEELLDGRAFGDFDIIGETGSVIIDEEAAGHKILLEKGEMETGDQHAELVATLRRGCACVAANGDERYPSD